MKELLAGHKPTQTTIAGLYYFLKPTLSKIGIFLLKYWYIPTIILLSFFLYFSTQTNRRANIEINRLTNNIEVLQNDFKAYKIKVQEIINGKDSTIVRNAAQIYSLTLTLDEYKRFRQQDLTEIANLKLKIKNVQSGFAVNFETDFKIETKLVDNTFLYTTEYYDFEGNIEGDIVRIIGKTRDGLNGYVSNVPKIKFLWWSWGSKGKQLNVVLQNPDSKVTYMRYITIN